MSDFLQGAVDKGVDFGPLPWSQAGESNPAGLIGILPNPGTPGRACETRFLVGFSVRDPLQHEDLRGCEAEGAGKCCLGVRVG